MALAHSLDVPLSLAGLRRARAGRTPATLCPLVTLAGPRATVLHGRTRSAQGCAMAHVVVAPAGVFVVGVDRRPGDPVQRQVVGGMITPAHTELLVGGRVSDALVEHVEAVAEDVRGVLAASGRPEVDVLPLLWLPGAKMPVLRGRLLVGGTAVVAGGWLRRCLSRRGPLDPLQRFRLRSLLGADFSPRPA